MLKTVSPDARVQPAVERIARAIRRGTLRPGEKVGTEVELAAKIGIGRGYVRRAVGELVDQGLIERRPGKGLFVRQRAGAADRRKTRCVQVVVPDLINDLWIHIARGAQALGRQRGIEVHIYDTHGLGDDSFHRKLPESFAEGAIVAGRAQLMPVLHELHLKGYPLVVVDRPSQDSLPLSSVSSDNYAGGYAVGKELLALGHGRIAFVGELEAETVRRRLEGLRDAIADGRVAFDRSLAIDVQAWRDAEDHPGDINAACERATHALLSRPDRPTAIFYHCDQLAISGYRACRAMKLRIPQDLSIVGFDGDSVGELLDPPLTTVRQDLTGMGAAALELLLERMDDPRSPVKHRELPTTWTARASVAPPATPSSQAQNSSIRRRVVVRV